MIKPNVSYCEDVKDVHYNPIIDWSKEYFTTVALEEGTFTFSSYTSSNILSYSLDDGTTWIELPNKTATPTIAKGDKVLWKGGCVPQSGGTVAIFGIGVFTSTCQFDTQGNIMSLLFKDDFEAQKSLYGKRCAFYKLFANTRVVNANNLKLPATTLAESCYSSMFQGCTSLTSAPELPATTLAESCYSSMFQGCTSLTTAPELPATTLESYCYGYMFYNCTNLNYIKALFTRTPAPKYTDNWVNGVAASGTFVKNSAATWTTTGVNDIPEGWTVETASA